MSNNKLLNYVYLAEASYADFSNAKEANNSYNTNKIKIAIKAPDDDGKFTNPESFAKLVTDNYEVVAHWQDRAQGMIDVANKESGFSGTLFKNKTTGEYVLGFKGSYDLKDIAVADVADIVNDGLAHHQIVDLYNFWQQIKAEGGQSYQAAKIISVTDALKQEILERFEKNPNDNEWIGKGYFVDSGEIKRIVFEDSKSVYSDTRAKGLGIKVSKVVVAGHSLGGHLAAAFTRLFPEAVEHAYMINGAGFGSSFNPLGYLGSSPRVNIFQVFSALNGVSNFDAGKIINIIGDKAFDVIANDWTVGLKQPGKTAELFIESKSIGETFGHGSSQMSDSMMVASLFFSLDNKLNIDVQTALKFLNPIFQAASLVDTDTLERLVYSLNKLFLGENAPQSASNRNDLYEQIMALKAILPSGNLSEQEKYENEKNTYQITSLADDKSWKAIAFQENNPLATAIRYALKELNPFAISGVSSYSTDLLTLYSVSNIAGMTNQYIEKRIEMLDKIIFENMLDRSITLPKNPLIFNNNTYYHDLSSQTEIGLNDGGIHIGKVVVFGSDGDDVNGLKGGSDGDYLFGGAGRDTLEGGEGEDYLEGGEGFDTYHIQDNDTVFDADASGEIIFKDGFQAALFKRNSDNDNLWLGVDKDGKLITGLSATRVGNDLHLSYTYTKKQYTINDGGNDVPVSIQATEAPVIKDFFLTVGNQDGQWSGLGIVLQQNTPPVLPDGKRIAAGIQNRYNTFYANDTEYTQIKGANFDDLVFGGRSEGIRAEMGEGNDRVYGTMNADVIYGENGNDILNGSAFVAADTTKPQIELDKDADWIIGGAGHDLINGMAGNDVIHTEQENDHLDKQATGQRGDWAVGHLGDDYIYGSRSQDFLQGGEGTDIIYGGADNDVILGDAFVRFGNRGSQRFGTPPSSHIEYTPVPNGWGATTAQIVNLPGNAIGFTHTLAATDKDNVYEPTADYSVLATDTKNDEWSVSINTEQGDYTLKTQIPLSDNQHLVEKGAADYLYGGAGHDLVIGQTGNDFIFGEEGNDILWGDDNRITDGDDAVMGYDFLSGGADNDKLYGGRGNDTLTGGTGVNILDGGKGFDTYVITTEEFTQSGLTHNTIQDSDGYGVILIGDTKLNTLSWQFNQQSNQWTAQGTSIFLQQDGDNLLILNENAVVVATIVNFTNNHLGIDLPISEPKPTTPEPAAPTPNTTKPAETPEPTVSPEPTPNIPEDTTQPTTPINNPSDTIGATPNTVIQGNNTAEQLHAIVSGSTIKARGGNDKVYGDIGNDTFIGGTGNDVLYGKQGHDELYGESGDDRLYGAEGNDKLAGGEGNDYLTGGAGSDRYVIERDFGQDFILNLDTDANSTDILRITDGYSQEDFLYKRNGEHLVLTEKANANNEITVHKHFSSDYNGAYAIDRIVFDDQTVLDTQTINTLVQQNAALLNATDSLKQAMASFGAGESAGNGGLEPQAVNQGILLAAVG